MSQELENRIDTQTYAQIQDQFNKIVQESGVNIDEDYAKEIENLLGINMDELTEEFDIMYKSKQIYVQKIDEKAVFPKFAFPSDSGFDLHSTIKYTIPPFGRALIPTGIRLSIPEGFEIQVRPKSGLALNMGLTVLNTPGTVDQGYTGEIKVIIFNTNNNSVIIEEGMKIGQAVLCPVICGKYVKFNEVEDIEDKERGSNGFGSTGII